jgi:hypothetical protein
MQQQAGLGVADAGWLAAINYGGYMTAPCSRRYQYLELKVRLFRLACCSPWPARPDGADYRTLAVACVALRRRLVQRGGNAVRHRHSSTTG